jgi:hypothetical protein
MSERQLYIGHSRLAEMVLHHEPAMLIIYRTDIPDLFGGATRYHYMMVQQIDPRGPFVLYWRYHFGTEQIYGGTNLDSERHAKIVRMIKQADQLLREYLVARQVSRITEGMIAMPLNYTYLDSELDVLEYQDGKLVPKRQEETP